MRKVVLLLAFDRHSGFRRNDGKPSRIEVFQQPRVFSGAEAGFKDAAEARSTHAGRDVCSSFRRMTSWPGLDHEDEPFRATAFPSGSRAVLRVRQAAPRSSLVNFSRLVR